MNRITRACVHLQCARRTDRVSLRRTRSRLTTSSHRDSQTYDLRTLLVCQCGRFVSCQWTQCFLFMVASSIYIYSTTYVLVCITKV